MIEIKNIKKSFGNTLVLNNLSHKFTKITCIMGCSGCGKTTLLNLIMGLEKADSGEIIGMPKTFSAVFQEDRLCEDFSAVTNLLLVKAPREQIISSLLYAGIDDNVKPVRNFSGGMKRRVALLRALLATGEIIILDEPFKGLDEETKKTASALLLKYQRGRDIIMVTHDREEAKLIGGEIWEIGK